MRLFVLLGTSALTLVSPAFAEEPGQASPAKDDIVVIAQRTDDHARAEQKAAPNLVNIQAAEAIAKYPDLNAAEALSRVPGIALSVDTAEGRFVNIRGLDGNLNGATFGGVVLLNTQPGGTYFNAAGRAVEFDTVPIGAIDRIVVTKTGLPDHDAEGLGGTVELTPRTAIGVKRAFVEATLGGGLETYRNTGLYRDEVVIGAPLGGNSADGKAPFSFVVTQFLYNDRRTFDDIEAGYLNDSTVGPDKAYGGLELRKYQYRRKRFGYSGEFDFTPNDDHRIYARVSIAGYNEGANRNRFELDSNGGPVTVDPANPNGLIDPSASVVKTLRDYNETHRNSVFQLGGEHHFGEVTFDWFGAYSRATYNKHFDYNSNFDGPAGFTLNYDNTTNPDFPRFTATGADLLDPANYALSKITNAVENDRDAEWSYAGNLSLPLHLADDDALKFGVKLRFRRKSLDAINYKYVYNGPTAPLGQFTNGGVANDFYGDRYAIGGLIDPAKIRAFLAGNPGLFTASQSSGAFFDDTENVVSGYAQYHGTLGALGVLAGVRIESTHAVYRGSDPVATSRDYINVFPTVQLRCQVMPNLVARATWSTGIARPGFYQTIQTTSVDVGAGIVTTGNQNLKPTTGNNFDLSLEYYLGGGGIVSFGLFDKEFDNFIVARTNHVTGYPGITGTALIQTFDNVSAHARGIEAAATYKIQGLPGLLDGVGFDANASLVDSAAEVRPGESVKLPGTFSSTANLALFYERGPVKVRVSGQRESAVLFGVGSTRAHDVFQSPRTTLDLNATYQLAKSVALYFNAKNLTNAPLRFYEGSSNRPIQREFYDATLEAGIKLHF